MTLASASVPRRIPSAYRPARKRGTISRSRISPIFPSGRIPSRPYPVVMRSRRSWTATRNNSPLSCPRLPIFQWSKTAPGYPPIVSGAGDGTVRMAISAVVRSRASRMICSSRCRVAASRIPARSVTGPTGDGTWGGAAATCPRKARRISQAQNQGLRSQAIHDPNESLDLLQNLVVQRLEAGPRQADLSPLQLPGLPQAGGGGAESHLGPCKDGVGPATRVAAAKSEERPGQDHHAADHRHEDVLQLARGARELDIGLAELPHLAAPV